MYFEDDGKRRRTFIKSGINDHIEIMKRSMLQYHGITDGKIKDEENKEIAKRKAKEVARKKRKNKKRGK